MASVSPRESAPSSAGIGTGVVTAIACAGGIIFFALCFLIVLLVKATSRHKRLLADLERRGVTHQRPGVGEVGTPMSSKPRAMLKRHAFLPYNTTTGWGSLTSRESIDKPVSVIKAAEALTAGLPSSRDSSNRLSWPFSRRSMSGRPSRSNRIKQSRLSAIIESPRSISKPRSPASIDVPEHHSGTRVPNVANGEAASEFLEATKSSTGAAAASAEASERGCTASLSPVPASRPTIRRVRSASTGSTTWSPSNSNLSLNNIPSDPVLNTSRDPRLQRHSRSVSLCSQRSGLVPTGPVPPLPLVVDPGHTNDLSTSIAKQSPSRHSVSSLESAGSSILATGTSPSVVPSSDAHLRKGARRECKNSLILGPRPLHDGPVSSQALPGARTPQLQMSPGSIKSDIARYSTDSLASNRVSRASSVCSVRGSGNLLSLGKVRTAEMARLSRVSSTSSLAVQALSNSRRQSRSKVTLFGSPTQRRKASILQDVSGNHAIPMRQLSAASSEASSTHSSNGNPFQWDPSPLQSGKPSALKGSPTARKGHRRQNCVRISLDPTIIGVSTSSSPSRMNDILEESSENTNQDTPQTSFGSGFSNTRSLPQPPTTSTFAPELKLNPTTLRASLTPSSPTLSMANFGQDDSVFQDSYEHPASSPPPRNPARISGSSSIFTVPKFPSPCRNTSTNSSAPAMTFVFTRPSTELAEDDNPSMNFDLLTRPVSPSHLVLGCNASSNQPYDPESPILPKGDDGTEYDPARPIFDYPTPDTSPPPLFSTTVLTNNREDSTTSLAPMSPPCSPKSLRPRILPSIAPIMIPTLDADTRADFDSFATTPSPYDPPLTPLPEPPIKPEALPSSVPQGPRDAPPKDIRRAVRVLRRMNSEATDLHREDRRYLKLGREASPALPGSESAASLPTWEQIPAVKPPSTPTHDRNSKELKDSTPNKTSSKGKDCEGRDNPSSQPSRCRSSVWDDGEKFWEMAEQERVKEREREKQKQEEEKENRVGEGRRSPGGPRPRSPPKRASLMRKSAILNAAGLGTPKVTLEPPSLFSTPGSLYDRDGFLK